ncbi:DDE-type integrase/transposase/recombinase [Methylosinus sp. H3A]|uniref:DDE-type integrase/transposase/recombinase n=1 Tax=Methylosinus sp. H3A TaxID=2785786 RepID=UPI002898BAB9|nr:DDE-type integrase/transposase/recombinase [Methylosinus sp. H3A]
MEPSLVSNSLWWSLTGDVTLTRSGRIEAERGGVARSCVGTPKRDRKVALRFLRKAIGQHGAPATITIDKSGANTAAIERYNAEHETDIEIRRIKYLNNIVDRKRCSDPTCFERVGATIIGVIGAPTHVDFRA